MKTQTNYTWFHRRGKSAELYAGQTHDIANRLKGYARHSTYGPTVRGSDVELVRTHAPHMSRNKVAKQEQIEINTMRAAAQFLKDKHGINAYCLNIQNPSDARLGIDTELFKETVKQIKAAFKK